MSRDDDWVETLAGWAGMLGMNSVRVRWRLRRLQTHLQGGGDRQRAGYQHRLCPACGALADREARVCARCGRNLGARAFDGMRRLGISLPRVSLSLVLGVLITLAYFRLMLAAPQSGLDVLFTMSNDALWVHGAWHPGAFQAGQWWRVITSMFLHIGMWHAAFNLYALAIVGPHIEDRYGRGLMLFFFIATGIAANLVSGTFSPAGNAGASGALMGLIGLAAARGHRDGTAEGRRVRDVMLTWLAYTTIFGFLVGADHWAHGGGFAAGGVLGLVLSPRWFRRPLGSWVARGLGLLGAATIALAVYLVLWPPLT